MHSAYAEHFADNQQYWMSAGYTPPSRQVLETMDSPPITATLLSHFHTIIRLFPLRLCQKR